MKKYKLIPLMVSVESDDVGIVARRRVMRVSQGDIARRLKCTTVWVSMIERNDKRYLTPANRAKWLKKIEAVLDAIESERRA